MPAFAERHIQIERLATPFVVAITVVSIGLAMGQTATSAIAAAAAAALVLALRDVLMRPEEDASSVMHALGLGEPETVPPSDIAPVEISPLLAGDTDLEAHLATLDTLFSRATRDTSSVTDEAEAAAFSIMSSLKTIETTIGELICFLEASSSNGRVLEIVERTDHELSRNKTLISEFLARRDDDMEDCTRRLDDIETMTDRLSGAVEGIHAIAKQTHLLALNAAIEASRAGTFGAGFEVVAHEVKRLSERSSNTATEINDGLLTLRDTIRENLNVLVSQRIEAERKELDRIATSIATLTEDMERLVSHQRDTLGKVQMESGRIAEPVLTLTSSIQFQDIIRQRLEHLEMIFARAQGDLVDISSAQAQGHPLPPVAPFRDVVLSEGPAAPRNNAEIVNIELF